MRKDNMKVQELKEKIEETIFNIGMCVITSLVIGSIFSQVFI